MAKATQWWFLGFLFFYCKDVVLSFSTKPSRLVADLQRCTTMQQVLNVGRRLTTSDDASLASLILVRLSKQLINHTNENTRGNPLDNNADLEVLDSVVRCLASSDASKNVDAAVEGTKACSVLSRLLAESDRFSEVLVPFWEMHASRVIGLMQSHHLSGLQWAFASLSVGSDAGVPLPTELQKAYEALQLPFRILPGCLATSFSERNDSVEQLSVPRLRQEVDFRVDEIRTTASQKVVRERRQTAWQGDDDVGPFCYSGKSMPRSDWSPTVKAIRDRLEQTTVHYYNGCLLNLYPDGGSGMRYHIDPDQGVAWDYDTAVVSVGATRRFAFRAMNAATGQQPHNFVVLHGDVAHMFGDCQERFQHSVKNADNKNETAPRVSLVFKRTWGNYHK